MPLKHSPVVPRKSARVQGQPPRQASPKIIKHFTITREQTPATSHGKSPHPLPGVRKHPVAPSFNCSNTEEFNSSLFNIGKIDTPPDSQMAENGNNLLLNPIGGLENVEALLRAPNNVPQLTLPSYSGMDHEDPKKDLTRCEVCFEPARFPHLSRIKTAASGLQGEAGKWWACYQPFDYAWDEFEDLYCISIQYDCPVVLSRLNAQLY